jgi:hypothetical protein
LQVPSRPCSRAAAGISLRAATTDDGLHIGRTQRPAQKEFHVFRTTVILTVFVALVCTGIGVAANNASTVVSQRPDGRLRPDAADLGTVAITPTGVTGRPDGRSLPDAADLRTGEAPPIVISVDRSSTGSFDWLDALIGALAATGVALAVGGVIVARYHVPSPAR